ncbi:protein FAM53A isoform X2 [Meles meles]|uniref:protein FAM53A isoform X2 n=1 Tax=Meles meles TaxID=9662 RepID=UPI001E69BA4B|nr:protein FAM53A isoform X2 [Meles meles]
MVTLITEKLQNQSLDDLSHKSYYANLRSAGALSNSGHLFPFESDEDRRPWKVSGGRQPIGSQMVTGTQGPDAGLGAVSTTDLRESAGPPLAPPTKRHCRSLSEPDGLARCRSPWRPGASKVWTPVSKRRCHSGGSATPQESLGPGPTSPPAPQPPWASSGCTDGCEGGPCPPWRRRLSLSQEHLAGVGTALPSASSSRSSTPELGRRLGLLRCRSQPCVLVGRRWRRRREERARWPRPSLDFLKMTRGTHPDVEQLDRGLILDPPHCFPWRLQPTVHGAPVCPRPCHGLLVSAPLRAAVLQAVMWGSVEFFCCLY